MHLQGVQLGPQDRSSLALLFVPEVQMGHWDQQVQLLPVKYYRHCKLQIEKEGRLLWRIKGIVHPKSINISIIYSSSNCSKPVWVLFFSFFFSVERKRGCLAGRLLTVAIDFYSIVFLLWKSMGTIIDSFNQHSSKYIFFVFSRRKKIIPVWNYLRRSKLWLIFNYELSL